MIKSYNFTKKDEINSTSSTPLQNAKGEKITVKGAAITERTDKDTGENKRVGLVSTIEYGVMSTISGTANDALDLIIDYMESEKVETVEVNVKSNTSRGGREFITLELL